MTTAFPFNRRRVPATSNIAPAFYRLRDVVRISALSRSTIYRRITEGRFPPPMHLGGRASRWSSAAMQQWVEDPENYRCTPLSTPDVNRMADAIGPRIRVG